MIGDRKPDKVYELPLWETNHSRKKLYREEREDWMAYKLGFEMTPTEVDPEQMAYKHFSPEDNVDDFFDFDPDKPVNLCMDFNRSPQTAVLGHYVGRTYLVFDEIWQKSALTEEQAVKVADKLENYGIKHVHLYGDNTSNQGGGRVGKNDWQYIKEELTSRGITFTSHLRLQNPKRKERVDKVNQVIFNIKTEERRLKIHPRCKYTIDDYKRAETDEEGIKRDSGLIGHISDACDYWIFENEISSSRLYVM